MSALRLPICWPPALPIYWTRGRWRRMVPPLPVSDVCIVCGERKHLSEFVRVGGYSGCRFCNSPFM